MKLRLVVLLLIGALLSGVTAPVAGGVVYAANAPSHVAATHNNANAAAFDKTRFVAHLAVAAYLIHYIYKKYKQGKLGRSHIFTSLKAAAAALIAYHEMKVAYNIASTSNSKTLQVLISPIRKVRDGINTTYTKLRSGDTSTVSSSNSQENLLQSTASHTPYSYKDQAPANYNPGF